MLPMILGLMLVMPGAQSAPDYSFRVLVNECRTAIRFPDASPAVDFLHFDTAPLACVPGNVTAEELARVVVHVADEHPDLLHWGMSFGLGRALVLTYPCTKEKAD